MIKNLLPLLVPALLVACSDQTDSTATAAQEKPHVQLSTTKASALPIYRMVDSFEVGENVYVRSLKAEPSQNAMWVGTSVGVLEVDMKSLLPKQTFTRESGLANEYVFAIGIDQKGAKWFGTNAGGMSRYQDGQWRTYFPMHGLADYWVYSFANHPDGGLWIGTWAGANRLDLKTGEFTTYVKELINEWVYAIQIDSKGYVWFGTEGGISLFDGQTWKSWTHTDGLGALNGNQLPVSTNTGLGTRKRHDLGVLNDGSPTYNPNYVFSIVVDPEDIIWAGTWGGGVSRFDGKNWTSYTTAQGLPGNIIYSMIRDSQGVLWVGTENGIGHFRDGRWEAFADNYRLIGENVYTLAESSSGEIWAGTRGKVIRISSAATP
ncbi:MAG: hypothetical protein H7832_01935 [Magnetococcus sp. DMHC-6]